MTCDVWLVTSVLRLPVAAAQAQAKVDAEAAAAGHEMPGLIEKVGKKSRRRAATVVKVNDQTSSVSAQRALFAEHKYLSEMLPIWKVCLFICHYFFEILFAAQVDFDVRFINAEYGRGLIALRDFNVGDVRHACAPL